MAAGARQTRTRWSEVNAHPSFSGMRLNELRQAKKATGLRGRQWKKFYKAQRRAAAK